MTIPGRSDTKRVLREHRLEKVRNETEKAEIHFCGSDIWHQKGGICVGDSTLRRTDARLNKDDDFVVCLPGTRIEHFTEMIERIMEMEGHC